MGNNKSEEKESIESVSAETDKKQETDSEDDCDPPIVSPAVYKIGGMKVRKCKGGACMTLCAVPGYDRPLHPRQGEVKDRGWLPKSVRPSIKNNFSSLALAKKHLFDGRLARAREDKISIPTFSAKSESLISALLCCVPSRLINPHC